MSMPEALGDVEVYPYVLKENRDDPPEEQVTFQLKGLKDRERTLARNAILNGTDDKETAGSMADAVDLTVALGLKGWEGPLKKRNSAGELVVVKWPGTGRKAVTLLHEKVREELAVDIMRSSQIGEHEAGN